MRAALIGSSIIFVPVAGEQIWFPSRFWWSDCIQVISIGIRNYMLLLPQQKISRHTVSFLVGFGNVVIVSIATGTRNHGGIVPRNHVGNVGIVPRNHLENFVIVPRNHVGNVVIVPRNHFCDLLASFWRALGNRDIYSLSICAYGNWKRNRSWAKQGTFWHSWGIMFPKTTLSVFQSSFSFGLTPSQCFWFHSAWTFPRFQVRFVPTHSRVSRSPPSLCSWF